MKSIIIFLLAGSTTAIRMHSNQRSRVNIGVRFVDESYQYDSPINADAISQRVAIDPTFDVSRFSRDQEQARPGWSGTRGIQNREDNDEATEFGAPAQPSGNPYLDAVQKQPCDKMSQDMEQLTSTWMNDPDAAGVAQRLDAMDKQAWAQSAGQASRSTIREFLSDTISDEVDKYTAEKADEAAFHPEARGD